MRGLSALCLLGIFNAIYWGAKNQWMFEPATKRGGHWWVADAAVGAACVILGPMLWHAAQIRSANRLARTRYRHARGEASDVELQAAQSDYDWSSPGSVDTGGLGLGGDLFVFGG